MRGITLLLFLASAMAGAATYRGEVVAVRAGSVTVNIGNREAIFDTDARTCFWRSRSGAQLTGFAPGERVWLRTRMSKGREVIAELADEESGRWLHAVRSRSSTGRVVRLEPGRLILDFEGGGELSILVMSSVSLPEGLAPGEVVYVRCRRGGEALSAEVVSREALPPRPNEREGVLEAIAPNGAEMIIQSEGARLVVPISRSVRVELEGEPGGLRELKPGMLLTLHFVRSGKGWRLTKILA